jgi:hypothetical protein
LLYSRVIGFRVLNFAKATSVTNIDDTVIANTYVRMTDIDDGDCEGTGIEEAIDDGDDGDSDGAGVEETMLNDLTSEEALNSAQY